VAFGSRQYSHGLCSSQHKYYNYDGNPRHRIQLATTWAEVQAVGLPLDSSSSLQTYVDLSCYLSVFQQFLDAASRAVPSEGVCEHFLAPYIVKRYTHITHDPGEALYLCRIAEGYSKRQ